MAEYLSPAVYVEELASGNKPIEGAGTSTGAFVGHAQKGPIGVAIPIQNFAEFDRTFGTYINNGYLAFAVKAFFDEGGSSCYVVRTCHYDTNGPTAVAANRVFQTAAPVDSIRISAASPGSWGDDIGVSITHPNPEDPEEPPDPTIFDVVVQFKGAEVERFNNLSMDPLSEQYVETIIERDARWITVTEIPDDPPLTPAQHRPEPTTAFVLLSADTPGNDGLSGLVLTDYIGDTPLGNGLHAFDKVDLIRIVAMPDATPDAHNGGMAYCAQRGDCFYVADAPEDAETADEVLHYKTAQGVFAGSNALNSKYGALYMPWIDVFDPRSGNLITIPPSGAVLGRYADTDANRGVHKAPAGTENGRLRSARGLAVEFTKADQEKLNPKGINVIRKFPGVGNVIWGARTTSADPEWRYLNVRRLFLFLETSIENGTNWTVFEPNDRFLWKSIVRNVSAFLRLQWLNGALVGLTAEEAFYVKCDEETNPQESIDLGRVITEIGVAPSKPAEFVIFRVSQFAGGSEAAA